MTTTLDVLVLEDEEGDATAARAALTKAGHRVHRCHDPGRPAFPCVGLAGVRPCPLDQHVDVALLVRRRIGRVPTPLEDGVTCAVRAGVPVVEDGPDIDDPFRRWVSGRVRPGSDVAHACELVADRSLDPLAARIIERLAGVVAAAGLDPASIRCRLRPDGPYLSVRILVPVPVDAAVEQALGVRALDAVRSSGRRFGVVDVSVMAVGCYR